MNREETPWLTHFFSLFIIIGFVFQLRFPSEVVEQFMLSPANVLAGRIWVLVTAGFLHGGLAHIFGNLVALQIFGRIAERELSKLEFVGTFFIALIISSSISLLGKFLSGSSVPSIGASGAISGVIGVALLLHPFAFLRKWLPIPLFLYGWFFLASDVLGFLGPSNGVDNLAHLGGYFSVVLAYFLLGSKNRGKLVKGMLINVALFVCALLLYFFFSGGTL